MAWSGVWDRIPPKVWEKEIASSLQWLWVLFTSLLDLQSASWWRPSRISSSQSRLAGAFHLSGRLKSLSSNSTLSPCRRLINADINVIQALAGQVILWNNLQCSRDLGKFLAINNDNETRKSRDILVCSDMLRQLDWIACFANMLCYVSLGVFSWISFIKIYFQSWLIIQ